MQSNTAMYRIIFIAFLHMPIHIGIYQTENNGFVAYQRLVMTFCIRYCFFVLATIGYFPEHAGRFPIFIYLFLDSLNPIIGNIHSHAIIKAIAAIFKFGCQTGHPRYFFRNGDCFGINLMNQAVGKCQITDCIIILVTVEVIPIITECFA